MALRCCGEAFVDVVEFALFFRDVVVEFQSIGRILEVSSILLSLRFVQFSKSRDVMKI